MGLENILNADLDDDALDIQTCVLKEDHGHQQPRDYSAYLIALAIYWYKIKKSSLFQKRLNITH